MSMRQHNTGLDQMKRIVLATSLVLAATGAAAAPPAEEAAPAEQAASASPSAAANTQAEAEPAEERKICRTEKATGSLTRRTRVCMTAAQWRESNARTYKGVSEMQSQAAGGTNSSFSSQGSGL
jgi:cytochrome c5